MIASGRPRRCHKPLPLSRILLLFVLLSLTACGGGGSSRAGGGSGGGGSTQDPFSLTDRAGLWRGTLFHQGGGQADLAFGLRFAGSGNFLRAGEGYREYAVRIADDFATTTGAFSLTVSQSNGIQRLALTAQMDEDKDRISGSWTRREGGVLVGSGTFVATPDSPVPNALDFVGPWSGELFSTGNLTLNAASFETDGAGAPQFVAVGAQNFQLPFDSFTVGVAGEMLEIEVASTALLRRYEFIGGLNPQGTALSGTWRYEDAFLGGSALDSGSFVLRRDLAAFPRTEAEIAGAWSGTATHPVFGETSFTLELDATGLVIAGEFGEFGGTPVELVAGDADMTAVYSSFAASLDDTFSQLGSDSIELEGPLSPVTEVWSGSLLHYFWGACTFSLVKQ